jgi:hypothetical protein
MIDCDGLASLALPYLTFRLKVLELPELIASLLKTAFMPTPPSLTPCMVKVHVPFDERVQVVDEKETLPVPDTWDRMTVSPATEPTKPFKVAVQVHASFFPVEAQATWRTGLACTTVRLTVPELAALKFVVSPP